MTKPQFKHHDSSHTFIGQAEGCDVYSYQEDGESFLVARRHQHPTTGFRVLPVCYAVVFAGRGDKVWRGAVVVAAKAQAPVLDNPNDMVVVRTHLRRRPGQA